MSGKKFESETTSITELLAISSDNQCQYVIPNYQRDYNWDEDSASEFINDIIDAKNNDKILFLGTMIFYVDKKKKKPIDFKQKDDSTTEELFQIKEVVDGQQRLTTIMFLLIALRNVMRNKLVGQKFKDSAHGIQKQISLYDSEYDVVADELRLVPSESISDLLAKMSEYEWDGKFEFPNEIKTKRPVIKRIEPIYEAFKNRIEKALKDYHTEAEKGDFCIKILRKIRQTEMIIIEIDNIEDAFDIFERNNARGLELETSDLLKNYLFSKQHSALKSFDIKGEWKEITDKAGNNIVRMIRYFYISHEEFVRRNELYRKIKDYAEKDVKGFLKDLKIFSKFYHAVLECDDEDEIRELFPKESSIYKKKDQYMAVKYHLEGIKLTKTYIAYPLLYSALRNYKRTKCNKPKSLIKLFRQIENFHFIYAAKRDIETIYSKYCKQYNAEGADFFITTTALYKELNKLLNREEFIINFIQISYKDKELISYIFDRFHNHKDIMDLRTTVAYYDTTKDLRKRSFNIEHWLPTSSKAEDKATKDNVGNLLLVPWKVNSKLDNYSPIEKSELPSSSDWESEFDDSIYMHPLKKFIKEYGKKTDNFKKWGKREIEDRAKDLAEDAFDKIWKFDKNVY